LKIDKDIKSLWDKADNYSLSNGNGHSSHSDEIIIYDDEYYLDRGLTPPRFQAYRQARWEKLDECGQLTCQGVDNTITQDELDFSLKAKLRIPPEQRYQDAKKNWLFHELSYLDQTTDDNGKAVDIIKEYGCGHGSNKNEEGGWCVPECRFYPETGRIEDAEVIEKHNKFVEKLRRENRIVEPPNEKEMLRILKELKHLF
jgi:hypothetical protein